jgi:hypothetical protein
MFFNKNLFNTPRKQMFDAFFIGRNHNSTVA